MYLTKGNIYLYTNFLQQFFLFLHQIFFTPLKILVFYTKFWFRKQDSKNGVKTKIGVKKQKML